MKNSFCNLGKRIKHIRNEKHITQFQLAEKAEISISYVYRIESGEENLTIKTLFKIADALQVTPEQLFSEERACEDIKDRISILLACYTKQEQEFIYYMLSHYQLAKDLYLSKC